MEEMVATECVLCGVAFDTGRKRCNEVDCPARHYSQKEVVARASKPEVPPKPRKPRKSYKIDPLQSRYMSTRYRSARRGFDFDLTMEFISNLLKMPCVYCLQACSPQLDRRDNLKGYTQDNVVPACKRCNTVKSMYLTYDEMMTVAVALGWRD